MSELSPVRSSPLFSASPKEESHIPLDTPETLKDLNLISQPVSLSTSIRLAALVNSDLLPKTVEPNIEKLQNELPQAFNKGTVANIEQARSLFLGAPLLSFLEGKRPE